MKSLVNFILENNNLFEVRSKYTSSNKNSITKNTELFNQGDIIKCKTLNGDLITGEIIQYYSSSNRASVKDINTDKKYLVNCDDAVKLPKQKTKAKKELSAEELAKHETDLKIKKIYNEIKKLEDLADYYRNEMENDPEVIAAAEKGEDPGNIESAKEYNKISDKILKLYQKIEDLKNK